MAKSNPPIISAAYDHDYEFKRNRLIPMAVREANEACGVISRQKFAVQSGAAGNWNRFYIQAMDRLAREAGIVK